MTLEQPGLGSDPPIWLGRERGATRIQETDIGFYQKTLWAYKTSKRNSTRVSHFSLTYGKSAVLLMEVVVPLLRVSKQNNLTLQEYIEAMMMELESADDRRMQAFNYVDSEK